MPRTPAVPDSTVFPAIAGYRPRRIVGRIVGRGGMATVCVGTQLPLRRGHGTRVTTVGPAEWRSGRAACFHGSVVGRIMLRSPTPRGFQ